MACNFKKYLTAPLLDASLSISTSASYVRIKKKQSYSRVKISGFVTNLWLTKFDGLIL